MNTSTCEFCGDTYPVVPAGEGYWDWVSDLTKVTISFEPDPYAADIHSDSTPHWICSNCHYERSMDI